MTSLSLSLPMIYVIISVTSLGQALSMSCASLSSCLDVPNDWKTLGRGVEGKTASCKAGNRARGYRIKYDDNMANGDKTGLNGVELSCQDGQRNENNRISSGVGSSGSWKDEMLECPGDGYITAFALKIQGYQGRYYDDTAVSDIRFRCYDPETGETSVLDGEQSGQDSPGQYGQWSDDCPDQTAVCSIKTWIFESQNDSVGLTDVVLTCC